MDPNYFDSPDLLFESQDFESLFYEQLGEQSPSYVLSSPSLTGDESVFDSPVTSPGRQEYVYQESPVHDNLVPEIPNLSQPTESKNIFYVEGRPFYVPDPISYELSPPYDGNLVPVEVKEELFPNPMTIPTVQPGGTIPPTILIKESEDDDDSKRGTKRTRKRRKTSPKKVSVTNDRNTVTLTREELLSFSSEQFEDFVSQVTDVRELTPNEKNELKRQRRLIKNRESAHASRQRKKSHIDELERRVKELTNENSLLKDSNSHLTNENNNLKNEVVFLHSVVNNKNGMANLLGRGVNFFNTLGGSSGGGGKQNPLQPNSIPATTLVLMIMLFSFGLFFNIGLGGQKPVFQAMEPLPEVITTRVFQQEKYEATAQDNDIFNVLAEQEIPVHRLEQAYRRHLARDLTTKDVLRTNTNPNQVVDISTSQVNVDTSTPQVNVDTSNPQETVSLTSPEIELTNTPVSPSSEVSVSSRPQILHWKSNTTYLLCENVSQLLPPVHGQNGPQEDSYNPPMISFLIPPDARGGVGCKPHMECMDTQDDSPHVSTEWNFKGYLEVTCQVLDMNFLANDKSSQVY